MPSDLSRALVALLDLMTDTELWIGRRVEAAKAIIEHEAPAEVFDLTHQFLLGIAESTEDVEWKLKALALLRKVEARRVVPGTTKGPDDFASNALGLRLAAAKRRAHLVKEGKWPPPPGWARDLVPINTRTSAPENFADHLKEARLRGVAKDAKNAGTANL